ncbi:MAG: thiamine pyrophosphate-binding protein [Rhodocyclaceae bacterium]|nr:thiamine pyrophosphate-binding protein [Rhodocyclaceae bacterium]
MDRGTPERLGETRGGHPIGSVADLIVAYLEAIGVEYVFGVPGGAIEPIFDALARSERRGGPRVVTARHESGAAFMADGYARESGRLGVCIATSGPGATNLITGVACAHENGVPLLAISGQPQLPSFGRRALQESGCTGINTLGMFRHCTRYDTLVSHPGQAAAKIHGSIAHAIQSRGATHLSLPVDIQRSVLPAGTAMPTAAIARQLMTPGLLDPETVQALFVQLEAARRPVFLLGCGAGRAADAFLHYIERRGAPFVTTPDAKGFVNPAHPLYRGVFGFAGHAEARDVLANHPDLIIAVGVSMGEWTSAGWSDSLLNDRLVHIDFSREHVVRSSMARLHVIGDPLAVARQLLELDRRSRHPDARLEDAPAPRVTEPAPALGPGVRPQVLMAELSARCPPSVQFIADAGNSTAWAIHHLELNDRRNRLVAPAGQPRDVRARNPLASWLRVVMDFAPMGWAIGAAVGIAIARRGLPVVCLTGDGSLLMNGQEMTVAAQEGLPVVFVILNDSAYGMVKHGQRIAGAEPIGFRLPECDFAAMARAFGIEGVRVRSEAELAALDLAAVFARRTPTVIDVRIDGEQEPPIRMRLQALGTA